eukprot:6098752-Lingulodinium_polyedra.AAC.1
MGRLRRPTDGADKQKQRVGNNCNFSRLGAHGARRVCVNAANPQPCEENMAATAVADWPPKRGRQQNTQATTGKRP